MSTVIPINVDRNVSVKDYPVELGMLVTEVFYTFQGEGPYAGHPSVFVRLAGCNIGAKQDCPWCDTRFNYSEGAYWTADALASFVDDHAHVEVVVFTGGEPLLQLTQILTAVDHIRRSRPGPFTFQIETNGLLLNEERIRQLEPYRDVVLVISPKITHGTERYRAIPEAWLRMRGPWYLKYVVTADSVSPYHALPVDLPYACAYAALQVYVSGMTVYRRAPTKDEMANVWDDTLVDRSATALNYAHAADLALRQGYRVSFQTHLFGAQK